MAKWLFIDITKNHKKFCVGCPLSKNRVGFTFIELLLCMVIVALLSLEAFSYYHLYFEESKGIVQLATEKVKDDLNKASEYAVYIDDSEKSNRCFKFTINSLERQYAMAPIICQEIKKINQTAEEKLKALTIQQQFKYLEKPEGKCQIESDYGKQIIFELPCNEIPYLKQTVLKETLNQ